MNDSASTMVDVPLRVGLLGAARIAPAALIEPAHGLVEVTALAARDRSRAEAFAVTHGIPRVVEDYAALVESPSAVSLLRTTSCGRSTAIMRSTSAAAAPRSLAAAR